MEEQKVVVNIHKLMDNMVVVVTNDVTDIPALEEKITEALNRVRSIAMAGEPLPTQQ